LHDRAVAQARSPGIYASLGAPDTVEGRFEVLTAHLILLVERLSPDEPQASQELFDIFVGDLDGALREMGVGDLAVPRRMKRLAEIFYGRAAAYRRAFAGLPLADELKALLGRTILAGTGGKADALADYLVGCRERLLTFPTGQILAGADCWPHPELIA
ncbi:MAG: ubiquinol-cytochrome C chaperone family protein, partial [Caulobacteraceae bacterium]